MLLNPSKLCLQRKGEEKKKSKENKSKEASDLCCLSLSFIIQLCVRTVAVAAQGIVKFNVLN